MEACQVDSGLGHQRFETSYEIQGLEDDMCGAVAIRRLQLLADATA